MVLVLRFLRQDGPESHLTGAMVDKMAQRATFKHFQDGLFLFLVVAVVLVLVAVVLVLVLRLSDKMAQRATSQVRW